jgi:MoxR-like ATPase
MHHPVATKLNALIEELADMFPERRKVIEAIILAILAKQHFFALGPPGTGKSALTRAVFAAFTGATYFETLCSKNRPGEALLGPISLKRMREEDVLVRRVDSYLPSVNFALIDELGKMSPTTGHDVLSILNERRLHQVDPATGQSWLDVPLHTAGAASNEVPTDGDNTDAAALWDRILVRVVVDYIQETSNWLQMLHGTVTDPTVTIDYADLLEVSENVIPQVKLPEAVDIRLVALREQVRSADLTVGDRRWKQSIPLLQASAFLAGRDTVDVADISVLRHTLWEDPADINAVERLTIGVSDPLAAKALELLDKIEELAQEVRDAKGKSDDAKAALTTQLNGRLKVTSKAINDLLAEAEAKGSSTTKIKEVQDRAKAVQRTIFASLMNMDVDLLLDN